MSKNTASSGSPKMTHHYGRGGAGNVTSKDAKSPKIEPQLTPTLKSKVYTTGRGGKGNMANNDFAAEARLAQDVDIPRIILPEGQHHTGRGGAANTYMPTQTEIREARENNERVRSEGFNRRHSKERGLKELAEKGKAILTSNR